MEEKNGKRKATIAEIITDVRFIVFVVGITLAVVFFITNADTDASNRLIRIESSLETIQNNHLVHIQAGVDNNVFQIKENQETIIELLLQVKELQTKVNNNLHNY